MAAIGAGWVDGAWIEASWVSGAWATGAELAVTVGGTIIGADEQDVRNGAKTITLTIANDTWISGAGFDSARQDILDGLDSAGAESLGWNNEVRDKQPVTAVVRTSDTVVTITLSAASSYDITASEEITVTIPLIPAVLSSAPEDPVPTSPTFTITPFVVTVALGGTIIGADEDDLVVGGKTITLTLTGDTWIPAGALQFDTVRQQIIDGLDSAGAEATGWNNEIRDKEVVGSVVRTSDTVVTITLSASAAYDISILETITSTVPALALVKQSLDLTASPTFDVTPTGVAPKRGALRRKKRRRVMIDGKLYVVRTLAEERALLAQYVEQQRMALEAAEPAQEPGIRAKIRRAERRVVKVVSEESIEADERLLHLRSEDEDILLLLVH